MSWLSGWLYRKSITINQTANAGTNYQVRITVHYESGSDYIANSEVPSPTVHIFCNSHCKTDFGDIRFTKSDGTVLDYWMETKNESNFAIFWIKIPDDLSSGDVSIYIYYGNPEATYPFNNDQSYMDNVFIMADHFYGSSLNPDKWETYVNSATISVANSEVRLTCSSSAGSKAHINSKVTYPVPVAVESYARWISANVPKGIPWISMSTSKNTESVVMMTKAWRGNYDSPYFRYSSGNGTNYTLSNWIKERDSGHHRATIKRTGSSDILHFDNLTAEGAYPTSVDRYIDICSYAEDCDMAVDWIAVRKYVDPEPTFKGIGQEEKRSIQTPGSLFRTIAHEKKISSSQESDTNVEITKEDWLSEHLQEEGAARVFVGTFDDLKKIKAEIKGRIFITQDSPQSIWYDDGTKWVNLGEFISKKLKDQPNGYCGLNPSGLIDLSKLKDTLSLASCPQNKEASAFIKADGTGDFATIQDALDAGMRHIWLEPNGVYYLSSKIIIRNHFTAIHGNGAIIVDCSPLNGALIDLNSKNHLLIENLVWRVASTPSGIRYGIIGSTYYSVFRNIRFEITPPNSLSMKFSASNSLLESLTTSATGVSVNATSPYWYDTIIINSNIAVLNLDVYGRFYRVFVIDSTPNEIAVANDSYVVIINTRGNYLNIQPNPKIILLNSYFTNWSIYGANAEVWNLGTIRAPKTGCIIHEGMWNPITWSTDLGWKQLQKPSLQLLSSDPDLNTTPTLSNYFPKKLFAGISYPLPYPYQQNMFYANGRWWLFYSDGSNLYVVTSKNGKEWSIPTQIRSLSVGYYFSIFYDGNYFHYAYIPGESRTAYYRRGYPNSDGSITWSASEQVVNLVVQGIFPSVKVDTEGYVWIGYKGYESGMHVPKVIRSGNNDGTWGSTPSGFPYTLNSTNNLYWKVCPIQLSGGKMAVFYGYSNGPYYCQSWNGSSWNEEVYTSINMEDPILSSIIGLGDKAYLVFRNPGNSNGVFVEYDYSSNSFSSPTTVNTVPAGHPMTISYDSVNNKIYVFWANNPSSNHIYYKTYDFSSWSDPVDFISDSVSSASLQKGFLTFEKSPGNFVPLLYLNTNNEGKISITSWGALNSGIIWYNTSENKIKYFDGITIKTLKGV